MNPEEGELRPQLLDRFGLTVQGRCPSRPCPAGRGGPSPDGLRPRPGRIRGVVRRAGAGPHRPDPAAAQKLVDIVELGEAAMLKIAEVCAAFEVDGMRADIVTARRRWRTRPGTNASGSRRTTSARPRGWPCHTVAAATRSTPPASTRSCSTRSSATTSCLPTTARQVKDQRLRSGVVRVVRGRGGQWCRRVSGRGNRLNSTNVGSGRRDRGSGRPNPTNVEFGRPLVDHDRGHRTPYRPRMFTVDGTGAGESGRRSRAITESGRRIGARPFGSKWRSAPDRDRPAWPHLTRSTRVGHLGTAEVRGVGPADGRP